MSIRIAGQVVASAGSLTAHNHDAEAHPEIRALIEQGGGGGGGNAGSADIAKAIENQNKTSDTVDPIYNWLGTQQEYEDQNIAQEHPDWVCFITDDNSEQNGGGSSDVVLPENVYTQDNLLGGKDIEIVPDPSGNYMINFTGEAGGGSAEIPDNVYTEDNLVAGDNIEIKEVVNSNVIDDKTLLCWHFDGDTKDVVNGEDFTLYPGYGTLNTTYYKFGTASAPDYVQNGLYITLKEPLTDKDNFTLDYWIYGHGGDTDTLSFTTRLAGGIGATNGTSIYFRAFGNDQNLLDISDANGNYVGSLAKSNSISSKEWSHWAYTYNKDTREFSVYANGVKQGAYAFPSGNPFNIEIIYPVDTNYNQFAIDEFRLTKALAWDKNFTPPTEAYTKGEGSAKKAISAIIPEGIYTQSNLLSGKDIEIIPEPVEGGIDEHTLACWHFDENDIDVVNGISMETSFLVDNFKFGKGCTRGHGEQGFITLPFSFSSVNDFSFDVWFMRYASNGDGNIGFKDGRGYYRTMYFYIAYNGEVQCVNNGAWSETVYNIPSGTWVHLYAHHVAKTHTYEYFINGKKIYSAVNESLFSGHNNFSIGSYYNSHKDEVRISNCIRWREDFTPPTQPYRKVEPTGNYVVNYIGKAYFSGEASKNIGEVYYSQSSLAADNSGAFPLFTGETIVSANTIYPEFYAWVENHTELRTTAEEYETALATYGECPKYVISDGSLRLPKLANYIKMANSNEGITQKDAGLPNINGSFNAGGYADVTGAFTVAKNQSGNGGYEDWNKAILFDFDASKSNNVYGNSNTVTPAHTTLYPWVCAYNKVIPESFADATQFIDSLSGKADINLSNTYPDKNFRENVFVWGLPDYTAGVSKTWNTDITAETNGWVSVQSFVIDEGAELQVIVNGLIVVRLYCGFDAQITYKNQIPVSKGDVYKVIGGHSLQELVFYPCKGESL